MIITACIYTRSFVMSPIKVNQYILLLLLFSALAYSAPTAQEGWKLLYENKPDAAHAHFQKVLKKGSAEEKASAHRGLAATAGFTGNNNLLAPHLINAYKLDKDIISLTANVISLYEWSTINRGSQDTPVYKVLKKISKGSSLFTGLFQDALIYRYMNDGNFKKAAELNAQMGIIKDWRCIGPFDNISNAGFTKVYPPELEVDFTKSYKGKDGNKTSWFPLSNSSPMGWIFLKNHTKAYNAIHYFITSLENPQKQKAIVSLGASGSYTLFLNGKEILRDSLYRNTGIDAFMTEVELQKGANTLLLKLGQENEGRGSGEASANFLVRIVDTNFKPITGLTINTKATDFHPVDTSSRGVLSTRLLDSATAVLSKRITNNPDDLDAFTSLVNMTTFLEMGQQAEKLILEKLTTYPNSSLLHSLLAEAAMRFNKGTEFEIAIKKAYEECPKNWSAWQYTLGERMAEGNPQRLLAFLDNSPEEFRQRPTVIATYILLHSNQSKKSEVLRLIGELEAIPNKNAETIAILSQYYIGSGRVEEGVNMVKELLLKNRMTEELYENLATTQMKLGKMDATMETYRLLEQQMPLSPMPNYYLAVIAMNQNKLEEAKTEIEKALKKSPYSSHILNIQANIYAALGMRAKADTVFNTIIDYTNSDFLAYESKRTLNDQKSFDEMTPLPNIDSLIDVSKEWSDNTESSAIISYMHDIYYYPSHAKRSRIFQLIHLKDQEAIDDWKERRIYFNTAYQTFNIDKAYSRKSDGTEIKADQNRNFLVYKSLEPGDYIVLEYSLFDYYQGTMAGKVYGTAEFEPPFPAYNITMRMVTPKDDTIPYTIYGDGITTSLSEIDNYAIRTFSSSEKNESSSHEFSAEDYQSKAKVVYSNFESWADINTWYKELSSHKQQETSQLRRVADSLFKGVTAPREKVKRVYDYIAKNINYSSVSFRQSGWVPQSAQDVLMTKIGDCKDMSSLGKALLNLGDVESHLVLENGNKRYFFDHSYIGPNFNHCILGFTVADSMEFIDFTDKYTPFGSIPKYIQGTMALVIDDTSKGLIQLPLDAPEERKKEREISIEIREDQSILRKVTTKRSGSFADDFRRYYRFSSKSEREEEMKNILQKQFSDITLLDFTLPDLTQNSDSLTYRYSFEAQNAVALSGDMAIFSVNIPDIVKSGNFPADTAISQPIDMGYGQLSIGTISSTTTISTPKGWKLLTLPKKSSYTTENLTYSLTFHKAKSGTITIERSLKTNYNKLFKPEEFTEDIKVLKKIAQKDKVQLLFKTE